MAEGQEPAPKSNTPLFNQEPDFAQSAPAAGMYGDMLNKGLAQLEANLVEDIANHKSLSPEKAEALSLVTQMLSSFTGITPETKEAIRNMTGQLTGDAPQDKDKLEDDLRRLGGPEAVKNYEEMLKRRASVQTVSTEDEKQEKAALSSSFEAHPIIANITNISIAPEDQSALMAKVTTAVNHIMTKLEMTAAEMDLGHKDVTDPQIQEKLNVLAEHFDSLPGAKPEMKNALMDYLKQSIGSAPHDEVKLLADVQVLGGDTGVAAFKKLEQLESDKSASPEALQDAKKALSAAFAEHPVISSFGEGHLPQPKPAPVPPGASVASLGTSK